MNSKLYLFFYVICIFFIFTECKLQNANMVEIVFFDLNDFDRTDTLLIDNADTVSSIKKLFSTMSETDAKFPRRYQITFLGKGLSEVYYSNGRYVRSNRKTYVLPEGKELILFESILNNKLKKEKFHNP